MSATLRERLLSRLIIDPATGCLLWAGATSNGYGRIGVDGRSRLVHRVMWEMFGEPIPEDLEPDHLCRIRRCASLAHLELVTSRENTLRGEGPTAINAAKDECDRGHRFDEFNTYRDPLGRRQCRRCRADHQRALRDRRRAS